MRMRMLVLAGAAALLASFPIVLAGDSDEPFVAGSRQKLPSSLDDMLSVALRGNPDLLVAEAGLRQAQAALNQARLQTAQMVATLHNERQLVLRSKSDLRDRLSEMRTKANAGMVSNDQVRSAALALAEADAAVAQVEAKLRYVLGLGGTPRAASDAPFEGGGREAPTTARERPAIPEAQSRRLLGQITPNWNKAPLEVVCRELQTVCDNDLVFLIAPEIATEIATGVVTVTLDLPAPVSIRQAMVAIVDSCGFDLAFVFREYGVLVTTRDRALGMNAPTIPSDVPLATR